MPLVAPDPTVERAELAAELHDLVTHQATVVAVQVAAAQARGAVADRAAAHEALSGALAVLDGMRQELRRLRRLLPVAHRAAPLAPVPSSAALAALLAERPAIDGPALDTLPGGVLVCAFRCLELLAGDDGRAVASVRAGVLVLDVAFAAPARRDELRARAGLRLEPCAGRLHVVGPARWRIEIPVVA